MIPAPDGRRNGRNALACAAFALWLAAALVVLGFFLIAARLS